LGGGRSGRICPGGICPRGNVRMPINWRGSYWWHWACLPRVVSVRRLLCVVVERHWSAAIVYVDWMFCRQCRSPPLNGFVAAVCRQFQTLVVVFWWWSASVSGVVASQWYWRQQRHSTGDVRGSVPSSWIWESIDLSLPRPRGGTSARAVVAWSPALDLLDWWYDKSDALNREPRRNIDLQRRRSHSTISSSSVISCLFKNRSNNELLV